MAPLRCCPCQPNTIRPSWSSSFSPCAFVEQIGGKVRFAPLRVQIRTGKFREPDILLVRDANDPRRQNRYWYGADLVVEIVGPDNPERDTQEKRADYAEAGIP